VQCQSDGEAILRTSIDVLPFCQGRLITIVMDIKVNKILFFAKQ
jgi:hypothetical protein